MALGPAWALLLGVLGLGHIYLTVNVLYARSNNDETSTPLLCYFSLVHHWPDNGTMHPAMNATLCTHMIMISTDIQDCQIKPTFSDDVSKYFNKIPLLRKQNPNLKILISNGGGNNHGFSPVLATAGNRTRFVDSAVPFLKKYDFDGLDIDWEFPGWKLPIEQRANFTLLLKKLREAFDKEASAGGRKYSLSAAVAAGRSVMEIYNIPALAEILDFVNLMCYDFHSYADYDPVTGYNSPLYPNDWKKQIVITSGNVGWSSYEWHKRGMPKSKIMVGIPTYTHTWTLEQPEKYHGHNAPAVGPGRGCNECTYPWMCEFLRQEGAVSVRDEDAAVPYAYHGDQWVSYDDVISLTAKAKWILENGFGGIMVYNMNSDDYYSDACGEGRFPLLSALRTVIDTFNSTGSPTQDKNTQNDVMVSFT